MDFDGKEMLCFSILLPHSDKLLEFLDSMDESEVWEFCADISLVIQINNRKADWKQIESRNLCIH